MTLLSQRLSWLVIAVITAAMTVLLFGDTTAPADAYPARQGIIYSQGVALDAFPESDTPAGRKKK